MPAEVLTSSQVQKGHPNYSASVQARVKAETTGVGDELQLNPNYFRNIPGIIKIIQIVLALLCMILISPPLSWFSRLFTFVVAVSFALTVILCFCYLVTLRNVVFPRFNWTLAELIFTAITAILYLITSIIQLAMSARADYRLSLGHYGFFGSYIAAGVFGLLNFIAYSAGTFFLFTEWRGNRSMNSISPNGHA